MVKLPPYGEHSHEKGETMGNDERRLAERFVAEALDMMLKKKASEGVKRHGAVTLSGKQASDVRKALRHAARALLEINDDE